ncbi:MAG: TIGR03987 family protein [Bacteroidales bacterium]|nr:TIGR03987 family protein [Bacteroidales bacterium]
MVLISTLLITFALLFYSLGVWAERWKRYLKVWHVFSFWIGFTFDISGTFAMHFIGKGDFNILDLHTLTGQIALWLMLIHAIWATRVIRKNDIETRKKFHRYSLFVWLIWLIPYIGGMIMGMSNS